MFRAIIDTDPFTGLSIRTVKDSTGAILTEFTYDASTQSCTLSARSQPLELPFSTLQVLNNNLLEWAQSMRNTLYVGYPSSVNDFAIKLAKTKHAPLEPQDKVKLDLTLAGVDMAITWKPATGIVTFDTHPAVTLNWAELKLFQQAYQMLVEAVLSF